MRCLIHSLSQLMERILPVGQREDMTRDFLTQWFADHLPFSNEAYGQLLNEQMIDVWSILATFTSMFQVRVQVFQHGDPRAAADQPGTVTPSPLRGPARDQDGNLTPVLHLYWRGSHFEPLFDARSQPLPLREPLGAGPVAVAAMVRLDRERHVLTEEIEALAGHPGLPGEVRAGFTGETEGFSSTWRVLQDAIGPQSAPDAVLPLHEVVSGLAGVRDRLRGVVDGLAPVQPLTDAEWTVRALAVRDRVDQALAGGLPTHLTQTQDGDGVTWLPARAAVHAQIVGELSQAPGVPREGAALIAGGLPGGGKSTLVAQLHLGDQPRYLLVDKDEIVLAMHRHGLIPDVEGLTPWEAAQLVREEVDHIWNHLMGRLSQDRTNLAINGMMRTQRYIDEPMRILRGAGYTRFEALFVDVAVDDALTATDNRHRRGHERWRRGEGPGGHYVPGSVFTREEEFGSVNRRVFAQGRDRFDRWSLWQRTGPDAAAFLLAEGGPGDPSPLTDSGWGEHVRTVEESLLAARAAGRATHLTYADAAGNWTAERAALQHAVADELHEAGSGVPREARAVIAGGPWLPGASGLARQLFPGPDPGRPAYLVLDPHAVEQALAQRGLIPEVAGLAPLEAVYLVQREVGRIMALVLGRAIGDRRNVLVADDMTGRGLTGERVRELRIGGYEVAGVFLGVSPGDALARGQRRHRADHERRRAGQGQGGRFIPPETIPLEGGIGTSVSRRNFDGSSAPRTAVRGRLRRAARSTNSCRCCRRRRALIWG